MPINAGDEALEMLRGTAVSRSQQQGSALQQQAPHT